MPTAEKISPEAETTEPAAAPIAATESTEHTEHAEPEAESSGGFREPHPETPAEFASHETGSPEAPEAEPPAEIPAASEPEPARSAEAPRERQPPRELPRERRPEPPRPKPWVKPADFRPAEASAISQAVEHATEIAESLKQMIDHLDEVLELVEVAERQKLADEREIEELRRALRRIQPPRREPPQPPQSSRGPRRDEPPRSHRDQGQRHDEPRRDPREHGQRRDEPPVPREPEPPRENPNPEI